VTLTPGSPYGDDPDTGDRTATAGRRRIPARFVMLIGLVLLVVLITSTGSTRDWWAHRLNDLTDGDSTANYFIGLVVGLLPLIGVALGSIRTRGPKRVFRMLLLGAIGFVATYLLAPSPARYLTDHDSRKVFDEQAPGYLAGVATGAMVWFAALVVALLTARRWWRRFTARLRETEPGADPAHRIIDI
jgi:hypothetical protein